jgi:transposase
MVGVGRGELTDKAWAQIQPLLPAGGRPGGRWSDHRRVINGILWKLRTGAPWRDLPERYGPLDHLPRPLRALAARRDLGAVAGARADEVRRGR